MAQSSSQILPNPSKLPALIGLMWIVLLTLGACDSNGVLMTAKDDEPDSTSNQPDTVKRDSIILLFSIGYNSEATGFFNTERFGEVHMLEHRIDHPFHDGKEGIWMPLVSPTNNHMVYFQGPTGRVTLVEGAVVEELASSDRTDFDKSVRVNDAYWSKNSNALYFPTGFGIASSGQFTTFRLDLNSGVVETIADGYVPVGHSKNGKLLLKKNENLSFYELDETTRTLVYFSHRVLRGSVSGVEWNEVLKKYTYEYYNRDDSWIGVTDSTGVETWILEESHDGKLNFGRPRWGKDGDIFYDRFERIGDRPTVIMKYNLESRNSVTYLTAQQLGFNSNSIQLADILRLPRND